MELIVQNEGVTYKIADKVDAITCILEEYDRFDICIGELLDVLELKGFSIQDTVDIYAKVTNLVEEDKLFEIKEGETIPRYQW